MMKTFLLFLSILAPSQLCLAVAPDYTATYRFTNRTGEPTDGVAVYNGATRSLAINNTNLGCVGWMLAYNSEGFSGVSINLQTNTKVWVGGINFSTGNTWSTFGGTASTGSLPMTSTSQGTYIGYGYYPFLAVNLATATGTGSIDVVLSCWKSINYASVGAGADVAVGGDLSGTASNATVAKISGNVVGKNSVIYPCASGSASATVYTCTTGAGVTLTAGMMFLWIPDVACSGTPTLNIDGNGAKTIYQGTIGTLDVNFCANLGLAGLTHLLLSYNPSTFPGFIILGTIANQAYTNTLCGTTGAMQTATNTTSNSMSCQPTILGSANALITRGLAGLGGAPGLPAISGCSAAIVTGSSYISGSFTSGTTGSCTVTLTFTQTTYVTNTNCVYYDLTTVPALFTGLFTQTSSTNHTSVGTGTTVSGDVVRYMCIGY